MLQIKNQPILKKNFQRKIIFVLILLIMIVGINSVNALSHGNVNLGQIEEGTSIRIYLASVDDYAYAFYRAGSNNFTNLVSAPNCATDGDEKTGLDCRGRNPCPYDSCPATCIQLGQPFNPDWYCQTHSKNIYLNNLGVGTHSIRIYLYNAQGEGYLNSVIYVDGEARSSFELNTNITDPGTMDGLDYKTYDFEIIPACVPEICDGLDNDCDGLIDEDFQCKKGTEHCDDNCFIISETKNAIKSFSGKIIDTRKIEASIECIHDSTATLFIVDDFEHELSIVNQIIDCNSVPKKVIIETNEDLYTNTLYTVNATLIGGNCTTCSKTIYLNEISGGVGPTDREPIDFSDKENSFNIPDNDFLVVILLVVAVMSIFLTDKKRKN